MENPYKQKQINGRRIDEHRYIMEQHLGRKLERNEYVHHKNGNKKDNRIENLEVVDPLTHNRIHFEKLPKTKICKVCGKEFEPPVNHRGRNIICSKECLVKHLNNCGKERQKPIIQLSLNGEFIKRCSGVNEIARELNCEATNIVKCLKGKTKSAYGYKWQYEK